MCFSSLLLGENRRSLNELGETRTVYAWRGDAQEWAARLGTYIGPNPVKFLYDIAAVCRVPQRTLLYHMLSLCFVFSNVLF
jgi:hypothetical protein